MKLSYANRNLRTRIRLNMPAALGIQGMKAKWKVRCLGVNMGR